MTTSDAAGLPAQVEPFGAAEAADLLKRLQDSALGLLAGLDRPPRLLRIKADQVELEVEWPADGPAEGAAHRAVPAAPPPAAETATGQYVTAHMVGVFYRAAQPGDGPFADLGDVLELGQQVGIIEAMKLMIPVEADVAGRVLEVLVPDGAAVEFGDRLFAVEPVEN